MSGSEATGSVELRSDIVVKRFERVDDEQPSREWQALTLLHEYAPGLAPTPIRASLDASPPVVEMSRVDGVPLRGGVVSSEQLSAMAQAVSTLQSAVPVNVLDGLPLRHGHADELARRIRDMASGLDAFQTSTEVRASLADGLDWLATTDLATANADVRPVFGNGDGNLANYLWDGERVRLIDFEYSGRSDRAFELAEIVEHVSAWVDTEFDADAFLDHFDLTDAEIRRLRVRRRLFALFWLCVLAAEDPQHPRNPPGTAERQAARAANLSERRDSIGSPDSDRSLRSVR